MCFITIIGGLSMKVSTKLLSTLLISSWILPSYGEQYISPKQDFNADDITFKDENCMEIMPTIYAGPSIYDDIRPLNPFGCLLDPKVEEIHLIYAVGDCFSLSTPCDDRGEFCRWRFISKDIFLSDEEGIRRIEESGVIRFMNAAIDERICIALWSPDFPCDTVNQLIATFKAVKAGRVIFYVQNKPSIDYDIKQKSHGCNCQPTIRKYIIDVRNHYCCLPPAPVSK